MLRFDCSSRFSNTSASQQSPLLCPAAGLIRSGTGSEIDWAQQDLLKSLLS